MTTITYRTGKNHRATVVYTLIALVITALLVLSGCSTNTADIPAKPTNGHVLDQADVLTGTQEEEINALIDKENATTDKARIAIITYTEDRGKTLDYATQVGRKWNVSTDGKENGIVIAMEVGTENAGIAVANGAGDYISDGEATDIINDVLLPAYQSKDYDGALTEAVDQLYDEAKYSSKKTWILPIMSILSLSLFVVLATWAVRSILKATQPKKQGFLEVEPLPEDKETGAKFADQELKKIRATHPQLTIDYKTQHAYYIYRMMMKNYASVSSEYNEKVFQKQAETQEKYTLYHPDFFTWKQSYLEDPHLYSDKIQVAQVVRLKQKDRGGGGYYDGTTYTDSSNGGGGSDGGGSD